MLVSSVPLSETQAASLPRRAIIALSSRPTRRPESEVSATSARHSRVKSSTIARMRKRCQTQAIGTPDRYGKRTPRALGQACPGSEQEGGVLWGVIAKCFGSFWNPSLSLAECRRRAPTLSPRHTDWERGRVKADSHEAGARKRER